MAGWSGGGGYFRVPARVAHTATDLDPLRNRDDFKAFLLAVKNAV